jgi:serine protease Do
LRWERFELPEMPMALPDIPKAMMSWSSPVLGIVAESLETQLAAYFGVKEGVLVRSVVSNSAAEKAGLKAGDVILKVDEAKVTTPREISSTLRTARTNKKTSVPVAIVRDKKDMTLSVALPEEPSPAVAPRAPRSTSIRQMQM